MRTSISVVLPGMRTSRLLDIGEKQVSRQDRTLVWLIKMLLDYSTYGKFNFKEIIDSITLNVKNDKAFSSNGRETYPFLKCKELTKP